MVWPYRNPEVEFDRVEYSVSFEFVADAAAFELPSNFQIGLGYTPVLDEINSVQFSGIYQNNNFSGDEYKIGGEYGYDNLFFVRAGYGFAPQYLDNVVISAIEIFNDTMYITTTNFTSGQLWRSGDGITFTNITDDAFGEGPAVNELRKPVIALGQLWLTGYTETTLSTGVPVWRSDDGLNWTQSNTNGFGDTLNNGKNASIVGFKNYLYFGGPNYTLGGQVWRTDMTTGIIEPTVFICQANLAPNPFIDYAVIHVSGECSTIIYTDIYDMIGRLIRTITNPVGNKIIIDRGTLTAGLYFYSLRTVDGTSTTGKFILK